MRKFIALILSLALCLSLTAALADQTVTVTGSGETLVSADTAIVSVGVNVRKPTAPQAQSAANEVIAAIRTALTAAGFSEEDINTGFINLYGVYDYTKDVEEIVAYNASSTLAVKVTDIGYRHREGKGRHPCGSRGHGRTRGRVHPGRQRL